MATTLIVVGALIVVVGLRQDLGSCRSNQARLTLGKFLAFIIGMGIVIILCELWLPSTLAWLAWILLIIGFVLLVRWLQYSLDTLDDVPTGVLSNNQYENE